MVGHAIVNTSVKTLDDKAGSAAGNVDVLADQVRVHASHEVALAEINVVISRTHLGSKVVAQPFGVHAEFKVLHGANAGTAALTHLAAVNGHEAVNENIIGDTIRLTGKVQHGGPEKRVEVHNVFANEVNLFRFLIIQELPEVKTDLLRVVHETGVVTHRSVKPDVEIFTGSIGNRNTEVGFITGNVPVAQFALSEPFFIFRTDFRLYAVCTAFAFAVNPIAQERYAGGIGKLKEVVRGFAQFRFSTGQS